MYVFCNIHFPLESFQCPENMLKCPGSYCVPQVFLCDGIHQCPGGEDEDECGTSNGLVAVLSLDFESYMLINQQVEKYTNN